MFEYKVIRSKRKTAAIQINRDGEIIFRCNYLFPKCEIERIMLEKEDYVTKHLEKIKERKPYPEISPSEKNRIKKELRSYIENKAKFYSEKYGFSYGRITITSAKTRFGSCSGKNDLSFSVYLGLYSERLIDYVVLHELCHTVHHNHSKKFYALLEKIMPDSSERERELKYDKI